MKKKLLFTVITSALLFLSNLTFGQAPNSTLNLGILTSFEAFTGAGGVANGAGGTVNGDVGTHIGIISGFGSLPLFTGNTYNANTVTDQARKDLLRTYIHLNDLFVDYPGTHAPAFGAGETITPGVYSTDGAGSIGGALTLDGGGNPNAFFVIKMNGALTVGAGSVVTLINGAKSCNVFWIANGAVSVAANANVKGTLFSLVGAVGLGADVVLEGRMFTMSGAITFGVGAIASPPPCVSTIPIFCEAECSPAEAVDVLGVLSDFSLYTSLGAVANTAISGINGKVGTNSGAISGYTNGVHIGTEHAADALAAQAAIDIDIAYNALMALPNTVTSHAPAFGLGETITSGVYFINGAGSLAGTITLNGENNPNAIFVFKFAGAFNVAALSKIILANGARRCNVFWIGGAGVSTGAVNIGAACIVKGTFLSHGGACNSGAGVFLSGRQLSTSGAVNTNTAVIYTNPECVTSTSLSSPVIVAVADTTAAINGSTGGTTAALTSNDTLNGIPVVIGTTPGAVTLTGITVPAGLTLNANSTVTIAPNTPAGDYSVTYEICEVADPTNCSSVTSTIVVSAAPAAPLVALVKTASVSGTGILGDVITYTFTVTNTGNTALTNVVVTDPMVGLTISGNPIDLLEVGASSATITGTFTISQADIDAGGVTNSALVTAQDPDGNDITDISGTTNDNDLSTITTLTQTPAVALLKTASVSGTGILGDVITYSFTLTNTGNTTLTDIVVTDPLVGLILSGGPIALLEVGASSSTITGIFTITQSDIDAGGVTNSALATAKDPKGIDVTDISGTANDNNNPTVTTLTFNPAIALVKTASVNGTGTVGNVITYIFTVKNIGNTTLTNILVTDPMDGLIFSGNSIASLAPNAVAFAIATYTITQADIDTGSITNSATAVGKDPDGADVTDVSGTFNDNDTPTVTTTAIPVPVLPDFTTTIDIDGLVFFTDGSSKDFVINVSEINGASSIGQIILKLSVPPAFLITYEANTSTSGGAPVNNNDWMITENSVFITVTLKAGVTILPNTSSSIGFTISRKPGVPAQTTQPITVTILDGSGSDSQNYNNTYNTVVKAQ
jgi:uncharacterized repeat protein (TIGR01451 family)